MDNKALENLRHKISKNLEDLKYPLALEQLNQLVGEFPDFCEKNDRVAIAFAETYQGLKQKEPMESWYRKSILINDNQYTYLVYANALKEFNENEKAKSILNEGLAVTENSTPDVRKELYIELARIALEEEDQTALFDNLKLAVKNGATIYDTNGLDDLMDTIEEDPKLSALF